MASSGPRVGFVSMHTSPTAAPGTGDAGGMNVVELHQARALASIGVPVDLITRRTDPDQPDVQELAPGLTLRVLDAGPAKVVAKSKQEVLIEEFSAGLGELEPYDLLHSHHWLSGMAALPVARAHQIPHVQSYHSVAALPGEGLASGERPESPGRVAGEALVARESDAIVAISRAEADTVIARCGADPARVDIIRPGVDHEVFRPARAGEEPPHWSPDDSADRPYLLFAARLQPLKAPDLAIRALAGVPVEIRPRLVIAGEVSDDFASYRDELDALVAELGVGDDVTFRGSVAPQELAAWMRWSYAVLVPSYSETFGLVALEAEASGVPVLAWRTGGLVEAIVDGQTGMLLDGRTPQEWADAISDLVTDPRRRDALGAAAVEYSSRFDWLQVAQRLANTYRSLVAERSG